jgi:hypothetical protein
MVDTNYKKIKEGQEANVIKYGHRLRVKIYEIINEKVYFKTINREIGQPTDGSFNRIECNNYLTVIQ